MNPQTLNRQRALELTGRALTSDQQQARDFVAGHHLGRPGPGGGSDLRYWIGPRLKVNLSLSEAALRQAYAAVSDFDMAIIRSFVSTNLVGRALSRHLDAVISREPTWTLPKAADSVAKAWWGRARAHRVLRKAAAEALTTGLGGYLRIIVKPSGLAEGGNAKSSDAAGVARHIGVEAVSPESVYFWEDDSGNDAALYRYRADSSDTEDTVELCFINAESGETVIRRFSPSAAESEEIVRADLGGRITYVRLELDALITKGAVRNNAMFNMTTTMMVRNTELAGFIERWTRDVEPPMVPGADGTQTPLVTVGPGSMMMWRSASRDETGPDDTVTSKITPGEVGRFEPVSADPLKTAADHARSGVFDELAQLHALLGSSADASGYSREVATDDFVSSTAPTEAELNRAGDALLSTVLAIVAHLSGDAAAELPDPAFACRVRAITPSAQQRAQYVTEMEKGVSSRESTRHKLGIEDSAAEDKQIQRELKAAQKLSPVPVTRAEPQPEQEPQTV